MVMGRKYNLNLNEGQNIFAQTQEHSDEIKEGVRMNIKWEPIDKFNITRSNSEKGLFKCPDAIDQHKF